MLLGAMHRRRMTTCTMCLIEADLVQIRVYSVDESGTNHIAKLTE